MTAPTTDSTFANGTRPWSFDELVAEGMALVPVHAPGWTQHNASDPGVTLVELFAYVTEILVYRALRVTPDARLAFLRLLDGSRSDGTTSDTLAGGPASEVDMAIAQRVRAMSQVACAVTTGDFERLGESAATAFLGAGTAVRVRAMAVAGVDLRPADLRDSARPAGAGDVSVVVACSQSLPGDRMDALLDHVRQQLEPCCLLTCRLHVVRPVELRVGIACRLSLDLRANSQATLDAIDAALDATFGAFASSADARAQARPFGSPLHLAEVIAAIDRCAGVDHVDDLLLWTVTVDDEASSPIGVRIGRAARIGLDSRLGGVISQPERRLRLDASGGVESFALHPWETVRVRLARDAVEIAGDDSNPGYASGRDSMQADRHGRPQ